MSTEITTTTTVPTTAPGDAAAAVGVTGAGVLIAASLVQAVGALLGADWGLAYRTVPETFAGLMLVGAVVALGRSGAVGRRWGARAGLVLAALGWVSLSIAQVVSQLRGEDFTLAFIVATLLHVVGMTMVGVAALRARVWTGWVRWLPLLSGVYLVAAAPLLGLPGAAGELAIAGWGFLWLALGIALVRGERRLVPCRPYSSCLATPRHAPRGVLLGRAATRQPSLVGLAMHAPGRRQTSSNRADRALA